MSDRADFEQVALAHLDTIWSLARRLRPNRADAEELVQETFLRAFAAFGRRRGGDARAWLVVICLNVARDAARRSRARPFEVIDVSPTERPAPDDPCEKVVRRLQRAAIEDALGRLPAEQRLAIELVDIAGLTAQAAADALDCPRGTVLARVHRGRRRLARLLEREEVRDER
jgi:RNA polymerase sigma-70 factor (ECF subfamily)